MPVELETQMAREIAQIPEVISKQLVKGMPLYRETGKRLQSLEPTLFITNARGSSDHSAMYFKYIIESQTGIPVASMGPSLGSIFNAPLKLKNAVCLTVSQSGGSPDLLKLQQAASNGGALTLALLNTQESSVGKQADIELPILAGEERAVAATKSFVASLVALAAIYAHFNDDQMIVDELSMLPELLRESRDTDWLKMQVPFAKASAIFTIGRGPGLALAEEAALKIKETCGLHAEAFSSAEVLHGPMALAQRGLVSLAFIPGDECRQSVLETTSKMRNAGALVYEVGATDKTKFTLNSNTTIHPILTPILQAVSFYQFIEKMSLALGENPDSPPNLRKVTETM